MKLKVTVEEKSYKTILVETEDFDIDTSTPQNEILETAELINEIKQDPYNFISHALQDVHEYGKEILVVNITIT